MQRERNIRVNAMQRLGDGTICSSTLGPYVVLAVAVAVAVIEKRPQCTLVRNVE